jgi:RNase P/RNase MRP subunit POP5
LFSLEGVPSIVKGIRRHRYIGFHVSYSQEGILLSLSEFIKALQHRTQTLFSKNTREMGLWVIQFNGKTGILKCNHREKDRAIQLLHSLNNIQGIAITIKTEMTSGTIRSIQDKT